MCASGCRRAMLLCTRLARSSTICRALGVYLLCGDRCSAHTLHMIDNLIQKGSEETLRTVFAGAPHILARRARLSNVRRAFARARFSTQAVMALPLRSIGFIPLCRWGGGGRSEYASPEASVFGASAVSRAAARDPLSSGSAARPPVLIARPPLLRRLELDPRARLGCAKAGACAATCASLVRRLVATCSVAPRQLERRHAEFADRSASSRSACPRVV